MSTVLKFVNINKSFIQANQQVEVLKNINFSIESGEIISLTGQSGSGKTTLLQIAGLLDNPSSGELFIDNKIVYQTQQKIDDKFNTNLRKKFIGFIYQFHHLLPEFSVIENVAMPLLIQGYKNTQAFDLAREILTEVELTSHLDYKPAQLSGGQQQRTAIARAIVGKPKLILADEPTGNLDHELASKIFNLLKQLTKKYQISCLVATHNQDLANQCDRNIKLKSGKIINEQI